MQTPFRVWYLSTILAFITLSTGSVKAVIFASTGSTTFNTTAPGGGLAGSGWQYQGTFGGYLGTPIASQYFITAEHFGGSVGQTFTINSTAYTTTAFVDDPNSDLRIWRISGSFLPSEIAPLYTLNPTGQPLVVFGRGTQRGAEVNNPGLKGWLWGASDGVQRWGTNDVEGLVNGGAGVGQLLAADFDNSGGSEAALSVGDSGGAVFIQDGGVWKLAGINYAVSGPYYTSISGAGGFNASLFDQSGFFEQISSNPNVFAAATGPGAFFSSNISSNLTFINSVIPEPGTAGLAFLGVTFLLTVSRRARRV